MTCASMETMDVFADMPAMMFKHWCETIRRRYIGTARIAAYGRPRSFRCWMGHNEQTRETVVWAHRRHESGRSHWLMLGGTKAEALKANARLDHRPDDPAGPACLLEATYQDGIVIVGRRGTRARYQIVCELPAGRNAAAHDEVAAMRARPMTSASAWQKDAEGCWHRLHRDRVDVVRVSDCLRCLTVGVGVFAIVCHRQPATDPFVHTCTDNPAIAWTEAGWAHDAGWICSVWEQWKPRVWRLAIQDPGRPTGTDTIVGNG